ncbi:glycosyl hydrolase family 18 protein [Haliovirga abyssi]|uniref:chitinase n=1 Tax=Haliovirga abyssi TaxID=2996794 RepID=A0AAU9D871_9FUSO|nr:glycosyl hydrolase family 18 protein [Haliovirga abyssi]BDU49776.1 hypothetical protein HLVA_03450 [Haliovirga abyssi]
MSRCWKELVKLLLFTIIIVPITAQNGTVSDVKNDGMQRRIIGYFSEWRPNDYTVADIPWGKITHINYAFAKVNSETNKIDFCNKKDAIELDFPGQDLTLPYKGHFNLLTVYKRKYPKVKTLISVGGWAAAKGFYTMSETELGRETFADSAVEFIRKYGFDGVDIDYEYPTATVGAGNPDDFDVAEPRRKTLYQDYVKLMKVLREKLDVAGQNDNKHYLLTIAAPASSWILGGMGLGDYAQYLDFINIMSYDFHGSWNGYVGNNSALLPDDRDLETKPLGTPVLNIDWSYRYFRGVVPPSKINIGIPYYTRGWKNVQGGIDGHGLYGTAKLGSGGDGAVGIDNVWHDFDKDGKELPGGGNPLWHVKNLLAGRHDFSYIDHPVFGGFDPNYQGNYIRYWDDVSKVPYVWNDAKKVFLSFEDEQSLKEKINYIINKGLGGMMIWELAGDFSKKADGEYYIGDTMTSLAYNMLKNAPAPDNRMYTIDMPQKIMNFEIKFSYKYDHPNATYEFSIVNHTDKTIDKGWVLEFNMPTTTTMSEGTWSGLKVKEIGRGYDYVRYRVIGDAWGTEIQPNGTYTFTGMSKLCFAGGPKAVTLNGFASSYEITIKDTDGDGLSDNIEAKLGTDPKKKDTDGDGYTDKEEYDNGTNSLDPNDPKYFNVTILSVDDNGNRIGKAQYEIKSGEKFTVNALSIITDPSLSFVKWDNNSTNSEREITVLKNTTLTATFKTVIINYINIITEAHDRNGNVIGTVTKKVKANETVKIDIKDLKINSEYSFIKWEDGTLSSIRDVKSDKDLKIVVLFKKSDSGNSGNNNKKRIVAYFPEWGIYSGHNNYTPADIPWDKVTHINYAFATIKNGEIAVFDDWAATGVSLGEAWDSPYKGCLGQFKKLKKLHPKTKTMISIGGWSQSANFHFVAATAESREKFADSVVKFIRKWDFDGVDIDWEYPTFKREPDKTDNPNDQGTPYADDTEKETFTLLLKSLRTTLDKAGLTDNKHYELSAAVGCGKDKIEKTEPAKYSKYLDFINIMTYDIHGAWDKVTGHQSPLYANLYAPYSDLIKQYYNVDASMNLFAGYGIPKSKLLVGSPYYSRGWKGVKDDGPIDSLPGLYATATGGAKGTWDGGVPGGMNPFYYIKSTLEKDNSFKKYRDPWTKMPYLYSKSKGEMYTYEDEESLQTRVDYVKDNGYGGIIFWELSGDYPSKGGTTLTDIIYNGFKDNTPVEKVKIIVKTSIDGVLSVVKSEDVIKNSDYVIDAGKLSDMEFIKWEDNSTNAVRTLKADSDKELIAYYKKVVVPEKVKLTLKAIDEKGTLLKTETVDVVKDADYTADAKQLSDLEFVKWSDGETSAVRVIKVSSDMVLTAEFKKVENNTNYPAWDSNTIYLKDDKVVHNEKIWQAKWWNKGNEPGTTQWGPWEDLGEASNNGGDSGNTGGNTGGNTATIPWPTTVGEKVIFTDKEIKATFGEISPNTYPDKVGEKVQELMSKSEYENIFPYRYGSTKWNEFNNKSEQEYYSYENLISALKELSRFMLRVETKKYTNRVFRLDKITKEVTLLKEDKDFNGDWLQNVNPIIDTADYGKFLNEGTMEERKRDLAAFLANISHETTGGWKTAPGGPQSWGLYYKEEMNHDDNSVGGYVAASEEYPAQDGQSYHGRGPIQLSYNYNYGYMSQIIYGDKMVLLKNPKLVSHNGKLGFMTGIWFWMTPQNPKPSCHDVMVGNWIPTAEDLAENRKPGFGVTINVINGGLEAGKPHDSRVDDRIAFYEKITEALGVTPGDNIDCYTQKRF